MALSDKKRAVSGHSKSSPYLKSVWHSFTDRRTSGGGNIVGIRAIKAIQKILAFFCEFLEVVAKITGDEFAIAESALGLLRDNGEHIACTQ